MKEKDLDRNTIVAYHAYLQNRIHNELNGVGLGPAWLPCRAAVLMAIMSVASLVTGILVITLRHRHVYLVDWWHAFLGPFFIILGLILATLATYLLITAKRRSNQYRRELFFRPIGDYGVAVVHKSTLIHEEEHRSDLKSGTAPHRTVKPHAEAFSSHRNERKQRYGHENHGYNDNGHDHRDRDRDRDRDRRHGGDRRRREDRDRDDRRRHDDRDRDDRRRRDDRDRRRPPDDRRHDDRRRRDDDRERGEPEKRRPPPSDFERRDREPEKRRPPPSDYEPEKRRPEELEKEPASGSSQGGRRAARGRPKITLTDSSAPRVVLDEDFGKPAPYHDDESEL